MSYSEYIHCQECDIKLVCTELALLDESRPVAYCAKCYKQLQAEKERLKEVLDKYGQHRKPAI